MLWIILLVTIVTLCIVASLSTRLKWLEADFDDETTHFWDDDKLFSDVAVAPVPYEQIKTKRGQSAKTQKRASNGRFA
jgi:hypothetical protein